MCNIFFQMYISRILLLLLFWFLLFLTDWNIFSLLLLSFITFLYSEKLTFNCWYARYFAMYKFLEHFIRHYIYLLIYFFTSLKFYKLIFNFRGARDFAIYKCIECFMYAYILQLLIAVLRLIYKKFCCKYISTVPVLFYKLLFFNFFTITNWCFIYKNQLFFSKYAFKNIFCFTFFPF